MLHCVLAFSQSSTSVLEVCLVTLGFIVDGLDPSQLALCHESFTQSCFLSYLQWSLPVMFALLSDSPISADDL